MCYEEVATTDGRITPGKKLTLKTYSSTFVPIREQFSTFVLTSFVKFRLEQFVGLKNK